jgi:hypothetical protein
MLKQAEFAICQVGQVPKQAEFAICHVGQVTGVLAAT